MNVQYLVDGEGHKTGVFLSLEDFKRIIDLLEEAQDIKDYRAAKMEADEWLSLDEAREKLG